jgi:ABC-type dipeptide/oligopeptide/nickel transport system permease component
MHKGQWQDWLGSFLAISFICIPALVIAPLAVMLFAVKLHWFPVALAESPRHFVLPTITLGIYFAGRVARLMREGMAGVMDAPFMTTARAKGLSNLMACLKHGLPIAILPVVSYSGPLLADLLTGSFVVENVFQIPGLGIFVVNSALAYDYTLIVGLVVLYAALLLGLNFLVDFSYGFLDPRVRN